MQAILRLKLLLLQLHLQAPQAAVACCALPLALPPCLVALAHTPSLLSMRSRRCNPRTSNHFETNIKPALPPNMLSLSAPVAPAAAVSLPFQQPAFH